MEKKYAVDDLKMRFKATLLKRSRLIWLAAAAILRSLLASVGECQA
jgi:hypothetical protein